MLTLLLNANPTDLMFYDLQILLDKFDRILKKLYRMPEAELNVDEGALTVLFRLFELFHSPHQLVPRLMKRVQTCCC